MPVNERYRQQVALLVQTLPAIAEEKEFALKGGTAINLFVRDMPRLSIDIDLTFLPIAPRVESLAAIEAALLRIKGRIEGAIKAVRVAERRKGDGTLTGLIVQRMRTQVKIEVTPVLRGCVFEPEIQSVSPAVEQEFGFAEMQVVSFADLYAGKILAALDRQHPRDLFDVRELLAKEGISDALRQAVVVYLISHDRLMSEVLAPSLKDIAAEFVQNFDGMSASPVTLDELVTARASLIASVTGAMPASHREFLISFKKGAPAWDKLGLPKVVDLPAVKWKQLNLDKLKDDIRATLTERLATILGIDNY